MHPCPMSTNLTALSVIMNVSGRKKNVIRILSFFSAGYIFSLLTVAYSVNLGISHIPAISAMLQNATSLFLGPVVILTGMIFSGMIHLDYFHISFYKDRFPEKASDPYIFLLGSLLALAFCPATASMFFGVLIPLSVRHGQYILFPVVYAIGVLLPLMTTGYFLRKGTEKLLNGSWPKKVTQGSGYFMIIIGILVTVRRIYMP